MRDQFFTAAESGMTVGQLRWGVQQGRFRWVRRDVYLIGPDDPTPLDRALAVAVVTDGVSSGSLAGVLLGLDGIALRGADVSVGPSQSHFRGRVRRRDLDPERITEVGGFRCTDALQTLIDLSAEVTEDTWEQALESALRKKLVTIERIEEELPRLAGRRGVRTMRAVLARRPKGAPPTGSILETKMIQLARTIPWLGEPIRQYEVRNEFGEFVAFVDLAWPWIGLFIELDGEQHLDQPRYDARRETAVIAATGWIPGRFTWTEVTRIPTTTARRLEAVAVQARRRHPAAASGQSPS
jgi:hypothetical protein